MSRLTIRIFSLMIFFIVYVLYTLYRKRKTGESFPWLWPNEPESKGRKPYNKEEDSLYWRVKKMQEERDYSISRKKAKRKEVIPFSPKDEPAPVLSASPNIAIAADWDKMEKALKSAVIRLKLAEPFEPRISAVKAIGLLKKNGSIDLDMMGALYELKNIKTKAEENAAIIGQADVVSYSKAAHKVLRVLEAL